MSAPQVLDLALPSGRMRAERRGSPDGPLVLCVHGLSANLRGFDAIGTALADAGMQVVAVDLRGRGASEVTPAGTYGLSSHAQDMVHAADRLRAEKFALVGWSLGAMITLHVAGLAGERLTHAVLIDAAGATDDDAVDAVRRGLARLDAVVPAPEPYVAAMRDAGHIVPWDPLWEGFYRYELAQRADGMWSPRTSRGAAEEDLELAGEDDLEARWTDLTMPTLLVRCEAPLGGGLLVPPDVARRFAATVRDARVIDVASNHFGVMADAAAIASIVGFLR